MVGELEKRSLSKPEWNNEAGTGQEKSWVGSFSGRFQFGTHHSPNSLWIFAFFVSLSLSMVRVQTPGEPTKDHPKSRNQTWRLTYLFICRGLSEREKKRREGDRVLNFRESLSFKRYTKQQQTNVERTGRDRPGTDMRTRWNTPRHCL